jgi:hypothetical protein
MGGIVNYFEVTKNFLKWILVNSVMLIKCKCLERQQLVTILRENLKNGIFSLTILPL